MSEALEGLESALLELDMDATLAKLDAILAGGGELEAQAAMEALSGALRQVGKRFQEGEWFLADLVYAGEISKAAMERLSPHLATAASQRQGTLVVGTVAGDLHDLGKDIFVRYASSAGFEVVDLGIDVSTEKFANAVQEHAAAAIGMSCLLTVTAGEIGKVIEELKRRGLRDRVKVIIGGAALTERFAREVGADAFAADAVTGTDIVKQWSGA